MTESPVQPGAGAAGDLLRFVILDEEDLGVMSAHLQDANIKVADTAYLAQARRFALVASRINWRALAQGRQERQLTGFHFAHVSRVQRSGFGQDEPDRTLQLLAVAFTSTAAPSGEVLLTFAGGKFIKLDVDCLEADMRDLSACWPVQDCPRHRLDEPPRLRSA